MGKGNRLREWTSPGKILERWSATNAVLAGMLAQKRKKPGGHLRTKTRRKDDKPKLDEETNPGRAKEVVQHHRHIETRKMATHFPGLAFVSSPEMQIFEPKPPAIKDKYPSFFKKGLNLST